MAPQIKTRFTYGLDDNRMFSNVVIKLHRNMLLHDALEYLVKHKAKLNTHVDGPVRPWEMQNIWIQLDSNIVNILHLTIYKKY